MVAKIKGAKPIEVHIASDLDDNQWHRLNMQISEDQKLFRVEVIYIKFLKEAYVTDFDD